MAAPGGLGPPVSPDGCSCCWPWGHQGAAQAEGELQHHGPHRAAPGGKAALQLSVKVAKGGRSAFLHTKWLMWGSTQPLHGAICTPEGERESCWAGGTILGHPLS